MVQVYEWVEMIMMYISPMMDATWGALRHVTVEVSVTIVMIQEIPANQKLPSY